MAGTLKATRKVTAIALVAETGIETGSAVPTEPDPLTPNHSTVSPVTADGGSHGPVTSSSAKGRTRPTAARRSTASTPKPAPSATGPDGDPRDSTIVETVKTVTETPQDDRPAMSATDPDGDNRSGVGDDHPGNQPSDHDMSRTDTSQEIGRAHV